MATALHAQRSAPPQAEADFRWLRTGDEALERMLESIGGARQSIRLETYIYRVGSTGQRFLDALIAAAQRGVIVQVLLDALGSFSLPDSFWEPLRAAGGQCLWFNPLPLGRWSYRDHRKILVCDDQAAFIGGFNIADEYHGDGVTHGWRDLGLEIQNPELVAALAASFDRSYTRSTERHKRLQRFRKATHETNEGDRWKLLLGGPGRSHGALQRTLKDDLAAATCVQMISAYFLPTWRLRKVISRVVKRGGRVQLILAGKSDVRMSQLASRNLYRQFLRDGVEIYEYEPQILHAKLFIIDDVVYAGSANLDVRSLRINYELLVRVSDAHLAGRAREIFEDDLKYCRPISRDTWRKSRSVWDKLKERWAYWFLARLDPFIARQQLKLLG